MFCQKNPSQDIRGWNILFEDDMSVFNDNVWQKDNFVTRGTDENEEPQIYMPNNCTIENGKLVLRTQKEEPPIIYNHHDCYYLGRHRYTSGEISSKVKYQYDYYEIYAKLPAGKGCWFWDANYSQNNGSTTIPQNSNIVLYATDFIKLDKGFSVPLGAELYLDICNECP